MVDVVNDIDLLIDWIGKVNHIFLAVLRLFGKVVDVLFSINFFQCKDLKVISFFWQIIDAVPQKQLQLYWYFCLYASGQKSFVLEHLFPSFRWFVMSLCSARRRLFYAVDMIVSSVPGTDSR